MKLQLREAEKFLQSLNAAQKNLSLYSPTHPTANAVFQNLRGALEKLLDDGGRVTLGLLHDTLVFNGIPLTAKADISRNLVTRLRDSEIQGVIFLKGCTVEELRYFVEALGREVKSVELEQDLKKRGISHILLVHLDQEQPEKEDVVDQVGAGAVYSRALQTIRKVFQESRLGKVPSLSEVQRSVEDMVGAILKGKHSLTALTMIKSYDEYLFNHSVNVGILATTLGEISGLDGTSLRELGLGALLHDLGKIHIPESITGAAGKLTEEEWEVIKRHPVHGVQMLEQMGVRSEIALRAVREHHVRFDRTGYPTLAPREDVHPCSMMVTIADVYDALTTARPYRGPFQPTHAIEEMKPLCGSTFDPEILGVFMDMLGIYPPGTTVRLATGEIGVVTRPGMEETSRPWVRIVRDREGNAVQGGEVSLMEWVPEAEGYPPTIVTPIDPADAGIDLMAALQEHGLRQKG